MKKEIKCQSNISTSTPSGSIFKQKIKYILRNQPIFIGITKSTSKSTFRILCKHKCIK